MNYQRITTNPLARITAPTRPGEGIPPIWDTESRGETLPALPSGQAWVPIESRPSYDPDAQRIERSLTAEADGWQIVDLTAEEIASLINQEAEQAKQATRQKIERSIVEAKRLEEVARINALPEAEAVAEVDLFPPFKVGKSYETGERFQFRGMGYHTHAPFVGAVHQLPGMPGLEALFTPLPLPSDDDPCDTAPAWNADDYLNYVVGYQVKSGNAVWEAINTTHTYIEPADTGNGAISWEKMKDCF